MAERQESPPYNYSYVLPSKLLCSLLIYAGSLISSGSLSSCVSEKYDQKVCRSVLFVLRGKKQASVKTVCTQSLEHLLGGGGALGLHVLPAKNHKPSKSPLKSYRLQSKNLPNH